MNVTTYTDLSLPPRARSNQALFYFKHLPGHWRADHAAFTELLNWTKAPFGKTEDEQYARHSQRSITKKRIIKYDGVRVNGK